MYMWSTFLRKFEECNYDLACLTSVLHQCYDSCYEDENPEECMSICNLLFEERAREAWKREEVPVSYLVLEWRGCHPFC